MSATHQLNIAKQVTAEIVEGRTQGYRVVIQVSAISGFGDGGVFLFIRNGSDDVFQSICSVADFSDYSLGIPEPELGFVRLDRIDLIFASQSVALEAVDDILADIKLLCQEMAKVAVGLTVAENLVIDSAA